MIIAQITDIHLGFEPDNPGELNRQRLDQVIAHIMSGPNKPDVMIASGDITDTGNAENYAQFIEATKDLPFPVLPGVGNHDLRPGFAEAFPEYPLAGGFAQYARDVNGLRILMLDTLEDGRHGGGFCEVRAAWLAQQLAEEPGTPTLLVMHHPPFEAGIDWMNTDPDEGWVKRFHDAIAGHKQIVAILCGHVHRPIVAPWKGFTVAVCPSTAPQLTLDLNPIDPEAPDERSMVIADRPAFGIHRWTEHGLVCHFDTAEVHPVLAKFNDRMQGLVRHLIHERPAP